MKVLEVFGEPIQNGGQESFVFNVLEHMDLTGLSIDVLTPYQCENDRYRKMLTDLGGQIVSFDLPFRPGKSRDRFYKPMCRFLEKNHYDIVHIHSGSISILALGSLAAKKNRVPGIIVHSHCAGEKKTIKYRLIKGMMSPVLSFCPTEYCACSEAAANWKFTPSVQNKVILIRNGVDLHRYRFSPENRRKIRRQYGISEQTFVIGHVGRFSYQKNHEYLIEVFQKVLQAVPDSRLLLVGEGELREEIRQKTERMNISQKVIFCGVSDRVYEFYSAMDVFALPSRYEGLPIVGVEAQANGLPMVISDRVSEELAITGQVKYVGLESIHAWETALQQAKAKGRAETEAELREKGYDINQTAETIRNLYLRNRG